MFGRQRLETSLHDFATAHAEGAVTVDVREPDEYAAGHVPGAWSIPLTSLPQHTEALGREAGGRPVYVVCASGNRSKAGAGLLHRSGVPAVSVAGGTAGWARAGHRLATGTARG